MTFKSGENYNSDSITINTNNQNIWEHAERNTKLKIINICIETVKFNKNDVTGKKRDLYWPTINFFIGNIAAERNFLRVK